MVEEGLRDADYRDITRVRPEGAFVALIEALGPDVVIIDLGTPSRDSLEEMLIVWEGRAHQFAARLAGRSGLGDSPASN